MAYRHGVYVSEVPSSVKAPLESDAGVQVVVGVAPVNLADDPYNASNVPLLCHTMAEAKSLVGYSSDFKSYTICGALSASFQIVNVSPVVVINVLDPTKTEHTADVVERSFQVNSGSVQLDTIGLLLDRKLIEECGRLQVPGRPRLYRTTKQFLRAFHLTSLDDLPELVKFGEALEAASLQTLNEGIMTKDLCGLAEGITPTPVDSEGFIKAIRERLEAKLA